MSVAVRETMSEAERCANTPRPLTRSTSTKPKEGLAMQATRTCNSCGREHSRRSSLCGTCSIVRANSGRGPRTCEVPDCEKVLRETSSRKVCEMHYHRMRHHGSYDNPRADQVYQKDQACDVPDCGKRAQNRGLCGMHAERVRKYGDPEAVLVVMGQPERRFMAKVDQETAAPCWLWLGWTNENGYGQFSVNGQRFAAHRWSYGHFIGPIPDGLQIDHVHARGCRYRSCVNPGHLEPVTGSENMLRAFEAARQ